MNKQKPRKVFLVKTGVVFILGLVFVFWFLNLKNIFNFSLPGEIYSLEPVMEGFKNLSTSLQEELLTEENQLDVEKLKDNDFVQTLADKLEEAASSSAEFGQGIITNLQEKLDSGQSLEGLEPTREQLPEYVTPGEGSCPAYINCMPTTGEARTCQIPAGCEGITQLVY